MDKKVKISIGIVVVLIVLYFLIPILYVKLQFISENEVKRIIYNDMQVNNDDIYFKDIDLEVDEKYYDIDLYYQNGEYEYKIDAKTGKIIYTTYHKNLNNSNNDNNNVNDNNNSNNGNNNSNTNADKISLDEAINIALKDANLNMDQVRFIKKQEEFDDGMHFYDIEFYYNNVKYEYKVHVNGGSIIEFDKDYH